ncbi:MAG: DUF4878 domain-containing protein [Cyanobacteria bacterium J06598_3]
MALPRSSWPVLFVLPLLLLGCGPSPGHEVKDFFVDLEQGNVERASQRLSAETDRLYGEKLTLGFQDVPGAIAQKEGIKKIKILEETVTDGAATVLYQVEFGDGSTESGEILLVEEAGTWKIQPMAK